MGKHTHQIPKSDYILKSVFWAVVLLFYYKTLVFRSLPGMEYGQSIAVLCCLAAVFTGTGAVCAFKRHRNMIRVFVNTTMPYCLYTILAYRKLMPGLTAGFSAAVFLICAALAALRMKRGISDPERKKQIIKARFRQAFWNSRVIASVSFTVLMVIISSITLFGHSLVSNHAPSVECREEGEYTIEGQIETLSNMREDVWDGLSMRDRLETLQIIANIEAQSLGLPTGLTVKVSNAPQYVVASYNDAEHAIVVDASRFETLSTKELCQSILHEAHHSYAHRLVDVYDVIPDQYKDLYVFQTVGIIKEEFINYTDGTEDFDRYYDQECEKSAREYSLYRFRAYESAIESYYHISDNTN